jgi:hypothetical protein
MTREDFIDYLKAHGCEVVRHAHQGYAVMRNITTRKLSGVPSTDPPLEATVCRICKTLDVVVPDVANGAKEIIEHIHNQFHGDNH